MSQPSSGQSLTDSVLQTQRDTIDSINEVADELKDLFSVTQTVNWKICSINSGVLFSYLVFLHINASHPHAGAQQWCLAQSLTDVAWFLLVFLCKTGPKTAQRSKRTALGNRNWLIIYSSSLASKSCPSLKIHSFQSSSCQIFQECQSSHSASFCIVIACLFIPTHLNVSSSSYFIDSSV